MTPSFPHSTPPSLKRVFSHLSTAVLVLDRRRRLVLINSAAEDMLELSARRADGVPAAMLFPPPNGCLEVIERAAERMQSLTERNVQVGLSDGRTLEADCTVSPLLESSGELGWLVLELVDVARHLRISREEQLISQQETARVVLRGLAHEVRNPLGGLRGAAQLLQREVEDPALVEYSQVIIAEADRLQSLLDRLIGPRQAPETRRLNIHEVTERVCALIDAESPSDVQVVRDYDPSIPDLTGDYDRLIQALLNVGRNAVQALESRGGTVTVRTRVERNLHVGPVLHRLVARIDIVDDGPGVPPEIDGSLFYPMVTGRAEGTGLGLSIAQSLIHQHGGFIECRSQPGETRFSILLPIES